jgi:hypothetical protein
MLLLVKGSQGLHNQWKKKTDDPTFSFFLLAIILKYVTFAPIWKRTDTPQ